MTTPSHSFARRISCLAAILFATTVTAFAAATATDYGKLPLSFEANRGQSDAQVKFQSRGAGYGLFFTDDGVVLSLSKDKKQAETIRMELTGATSGVHVSGRGELSGKANYFIGNDPSKWHSNIPTYDKVQYQSVYPGIDLVYYGNQRQLEYDLVVAAGSDPKPIQLHFAGAERLRLAASGDLSVIAKNGTIVFHKPVVYQTIGSQRRTVEGRFQLLANNTITFKLGSYDRSRTLVIDPTLEYSTYLGGTINDYALGLTTDATGAAYVTGVATSTNFPVTSGAYQKTNNESASSRSNAFVTKINAAGTALVYSTYLGGAANSCSNNKNTLTQGDYGAAIAVDAEGSAYITGTACGGTFPTTTGAFQTTFSTDAASNAFITKLNTTGSALVYSTFLGGGGDYYSGDFGTGIAVDASGNAYVTGQTSSSNFPVTKGAFQTTYKNTSGTNNAFVTKLNSTGKALIYSTYLGGSGTGESAVPGDSGNAIAINASGNAYVTGYTYSKDFPVTSGAYQTTNKAFANKLADPFVSELNAAGSALVFSTFLGGSGTTADPYPDSGNSIALDASGNIYIAGGTASTDHPVTADAFQKKNASTISSANGFISKLNPTGTELLYSTYLGGGGHSGCGGDRVYALALDGEGNTYLTGYTCSNNFPVTSGAFQTTNKGYANTSEDAYLTQLNASGSALLYSTYFGGTGTTANANGDYGNAITFNAGNVYFAGLTESTNFPVTSSAYQKTLKATPSGNSNAFISKFAFASATTTSLSTDGTPQKLGVKVTFTADVVPSTGAGTPTGTVDFSVDGGAAVAATLDDTGHAEYSTSTLAEGTHTIIASYLGDATHLASKSAALTETIYGAISTLTVVSGSGQSGPINTAYKLPLIIIAKDAKGDVIPGLVVTYSGTGLKFSSTTATTAANGEASVTATPTVTGSLTATATSGGKTATFALTATGGTVATPSASQTITIADATSGATIYYTTDGTTPTTSSKKYTGPITITASETLKFIAVVSGDSNSAVRTVTDTIQ
jgi:hypothetical protein